MSKLEHYYAHEPAGLRKERLIAGLLQKEQQRLGKKHLRILDIGCGAGHLSAFSAMLGHDVTAIDTSSAAIAEAVEQYGPIGINFKNVPIAEVEGEFDVITAFEVCEHIPEVNIFLKEVYYRLIPFGLLIISVPNGRSLEELLRRFAQHTAFGRALKKFLRHTKILPKSSGQSAADSPHVHFWGAGKWQRVFRSAGFDIISIWNVSLFFKQLYYLGGRRFIKPGKFLFRFLNRLDEILVHSLPRPLADGWLMAWRKKE